MANERIGINMSLEDTVNTISDGNFGAFRACFEVLAHGDLIDPYGGGLGSLLELDVLNIWGERLYRMWHDVCKGDVGKMIAVLRAHQLGQIAGVTTETIQHAIEGQEEGMDLDAVINAVKERLPNFDPLARAKLNS